LRQRCSRPLPATWCRSAHDRSRAHEWHMSHRTNVSLPLLLPWHRSNDQLLRVDSWHGCFARRSDCVTDDQRHLMRRTPRPQFNRVDSKNALSNVVQRCFHSEREGGTRGERRGSDSFLTPNPPVCGPLRTAALARPGQLGSGMITSPCLTYLMKLRPSRHRSDHLQDT
jgi:hypothetical protein